MNDWPATEQDLPELVGDSFDDYRDHFAVLGAEDPLAGRGASHPAPWAGP